jgi:dienelactone hydrolase
MLDKLLMLAVLASAAPSLAQNAQPFDAAAAFGARESVSQMSLSPDGQNVTYISPTDGQGALAYTLSLVKGASPKVAMRATGRPERIGGCDWASNERIICTVYASKRDATFGILVWSRIVASNADATGFQVLSKRDRSYARGFQLGGGNVIDWLPDEHGAVLMTRVYVPNDRAGSRLGSASSGLGVDWIDTQTLATKEIEAPRPEAVGYLTDGRGTVRIMALRKGTQTAFGFQDKGTIEYMYRAPGSRDWRQLSEYNYVDRSGFEPAAIDPDLNRAFGFKKKDGRLAVYSIALDDSLAEELVYANPDVDVDTLIQIGRRQRVVGASYVTDTRKSIYFSAPIEQLLTALHKALPQQPLLRVVDSSVDENTMLIFAGSDSDPGVYYIFDRKTHQLQTFLVVRGALEGVKLASVKSISYPAADGVMIPAYLTLPPGKESAKGLPAIVLPHGGPSARDEWGFDWLSQFFASRGYAVLQPNFRGSSGYGDAWFEKNGFRSWRIAIGDVDAGGHWLVSEGIADPAKLGIFGWSYGGYAALQSAVTEPGLFKAVVAVAPVTDLAALKDQYRGWSDHELVNEMVGDGAQMHEGSPAEHADKIKAPVLLFHGDFDRNVKIDHSKLMCSRLTQAGGKCELVTWDDLDHYLDDSSARAQMLRRSDEFLRTAFGM